MHVTPAFLKTFQLLMCLDTQNTAGLQCITPAVREQGFSSSEGHKLNKQKCANQTDASYLKDRHEVRK